MGASTLLCLVTLFYVLTLVGAAPFADKRQTTRKLSPEEIAAFKPYSHFTASGACDSEATLPWNCTSCSAEPQFQVVAVGGDGVLEQFWYVGYDPTLNTIVVAHQGTVVENVIPVLTDLDISLANLDSVRFPGLSNNIKVHHGFREAHERAADDVLAAVQETHTRYNATHITLVGHSLGAAISLLDSIYLPLHLSGFTYKSVLFGLPRVGNQQFADYVDAHVTDLARITNKRDPVPTLPPRFAGYKHSSGEIHIDDDGSWVSCAGQDNESGECVIGDVPTIFQYRPEDHSGPYDGINLSCRG